MKMIGKLLATVLLALSPAFAEDAPLSVVASYSILGEWVEKVGGDAIQLSMLVGPDADAHTFEPTPADVATLSEAELIFENGLEFETWLDSLYASSGSDARRVVVTEGLELLEAENGHEHHGDGEGAHEEEAHEGEHEEDHEGEEHESEEHAHEEEHEEAGHGHDHGEFDPHVWHDVSNVIVMVANIRDALTQADPDNAERYRANAAAYTAELEALDAFIMESVATLPEERRKLVTSHDSFGYFAARYGFEVVGTVLPSVSTEVADPPAGELAALIDEIQAAGVPAIFAENVSNPRLLERVASGAGVTVAPTLYTDALGTPGSEGETYLAMMRYNTMTIVEALSE